MDHELKLFLKKKKKKHCTHITFYTYFDIKIHYMDKEWNSLAKGYNTTSLYEEKNATSS